MALVFVLIMISIIFVIAAVSSRVVTLGERTARNDRDRQTALQSAEAALSDAEMDIMGPNSLSGTTRGDVRHPAGGRGLQQRQHDTRGYCGGLASGAYKTIFADEILIAGLRQLWRVHGRPRTVPGLHNRRAARQAAALHHRKVTDQLPQPRGHGRRAL